MPHHISDISSHLFASKCMLVAGHVGLFGKFKGFDWKACHARDLHSLCYRVALFSVGYRTILEEHVCKSEAKGL